MATNKRFIPTVLALISLGMLGTGCGKKKTVVTTQGGQVTMENSGDKATYEVKTKEGNFKMTASDKGEISLPDNFPKDVPLYKGAKIKMATTTGKMMMVMQETKDNAPDVIKFYSDGLKAQGWEIETTMNMGDMSLVIGKKGKNSCQVTAGKIPEGTTVQIAVGEE